MRKVLEVPMLCLFRDVVVYSVWDNRGGNRQSMLVRWRDWDNLVQ
jgi:hypothetical protein